METQTTTTQNPSKAEIADLTDRSQFLQSLGFGHADSKRRDEAQLEPSRAEEANQISNQGVAAPIREAMMLSSNFEDDLELPGAPPQMAPLVEEIEAKVELGADRAEVANRLNDDVAITNIPLPSALFETESQFDIASVDDSVWSAVDCRMRPERPAADQAETEMASVGQKKNDSSDLVEEKTSEDDTETGNRLERENSNLSSGSISPEGELEFLESQEEEEIETLQLNCPGCERGLTLLPQHLGIAGSCVWCDIPIIAAVSGVDQSISIFELAPPKAIQGEATVEVAEPLPMPASDSLNENILREVAETAEPMIDSETRESGVSGSQVGDSGKTIEPEIIEPKEVAETQGSLSASVTSFPWNPPAMPDEQSPDKGEKKIEEISSAESAVRSEEFGDPDSSAGNSRPESEPTRPMLDAAPVEMLKADSAEGVTLPEAKDPFAESHQQASPFGDFPVVDPTETQTESAFPESFKEPTVEDLIETSEPGPSPVVDDASLPEPSLPLMSGFSEFAAEPQARILVPAELPKSKLPPLPPETEPVEDGTPVAEIPSPFESQPIETPDAVQPSPFDAPVNQEQNPTPSATTNGTTTVKPPLPWDEPKPNEETALPEPISNTEKAPPIEPVQLPATDGPLPPLEEVSQPAEVAVSKRKTAPKSKGGGAKAAVLIALLGLLSGAGIASFFLPVDTYVEKGKAAWTSWFESKVGVNNDWNDGVIAQPPRKQAFLDEPDPFLNPHPSEQPR